MVSVTLLSILMAQPSIPYSPDWRREVNSDEMGNSVRHYRSLHYFGFFESGYIMCSFSVDHGDKWK